MFRRSIRMKCLDRPARQTMKRPGGSLREQHRAVIVNRLNPIPWQGRVIGRDGLLPGPTIGEIKGDFMPVDGYWISTAQPQNPR